MIVVREVISMRDFSDIGDEETIALEDLIPSGGYSFQSKYLQDFLVFSDKMKAILNDLKKMASTATIPLMITGPTGSGKELVAKFMHYEVDRSEGKYIGINCTNINREMFESELFGYKKGAFTGASEKGRQGYIKQAEQGTLFLDEISELDQEIQAKLLRVLEEEEYYPLGGTSKEHVNCRMIFASNRNLEKLVEQGRLRKDLYYRLNVVNVSVPSIKERKECIIPFLTSFIAQLNQQFQKDVRFIQGKVLKYMYQYNWPGNIRELKNFITQIMVFIEGDTIKYEHLQTKDELDRLNARSLSDNLHSKNRSKAEIIDELLKEPLDLEKFTMDIVRTALEKFRGNKSKTAQFLHLKREQLYNRYKID